MISTIGRVVWGSSQAQAGVLFKVIVFLGLVVRFIMVEAGVLDYDPSNPCKCDRLVSGGKC